MSRETEYPEWSRIPVPLQHQFFSHARKEALTCKKKLTEQGEKLQHFRKHLKFQKVPEDDQWKNWRIACVDGSYSPAISERTGARYGVYCAGYMVFENGEIKEEKYRSGKLTQDQVRDPEITRRILILLDTKLEREIALHCLENLDVDLLLIDGSFFGFRSGMYKLRNLETDLKEFERVGDLVDYVRDLTVQLTKTGKTVGVIKRVRTASFDGWLTYTNGSEASCVGRNDKAILAYLMPRNHWFAYEWLLGRPDAFLFFAQFRYYFMQTGSRNVDYVFKKSKKEVKSAIKRNLNCDAEDILQLSRYYIRCSETTLPFCFETRKKADVKPLLAYFQANYNPVTGLPFPIDLIDENVSLPRGFTKEFVEEVEALLIQDKALDKLDLSNYFMYLNPQKEE